MSGFAVGAEVRVSVLVEDGHHEQAVMHDPVAHGVREAVGGELALDDLVSRTLRVANQLDKQAAA